MQFSDIIFLAWEFCIFELDFVVLIHQFTVLEEVDA